MYIDFGNLRMAVAAGPSGRPCFSSLPAMVVMTPLPSIFRMRLLRLSAR